MPQSRSSTNASRQEGEGDDYGAVVPYGQRSSQQSRATASQRTTSGRPSQMQVALPGSRPSQMQVALPDRRQELHVIDPGRSTSNRPSQMQVALPSHRHAEPNRYSARPSQMQVALPGQRSIEPYWGEPTHSTKKVQSNRTEHSSRPQAALPSIRESEPSRYGSLPQESALRALPNIREAEPNRYTQPSRQLQHTRANEPYRETRQLISIPSRHEPEPGQIAPTRYSDRPQGVQTRMVLPGEPHHFGSRADYQTGEIECTLCRCNNPESHGDAYTMLNSPRGLDSHGKPIDWQEAKKRMLSYHGKDQISHAEEVAAIPYIYSAETARHALEHEEILKQGARAGCGVRVNVEENITNWHNADGHAKPHLTPGGSKTQYNPSGGTTSRYG